MKKALRFLSVVSLLLIPTISGAEAITLRLGVLQFGTVNWELDVIKHHALDRKFGVDLQITPLGGKNATHVALQGGSVDVIVSDWIWVTRQRSQGRQYTFSPYSNAVGSLMVPANLGIHSLEDLQDKKLGVAGGAVDKTWLLLRAYSRKVLDKDLVDMLEPSFAAPPLLNKLALRGDLDAVINFWHYAARLQASGFSPLLQMPEILAALGVHRPIPLIGWVFNEQWATENQQAIIGLLNASREAKRILRDSDTEWSRLRSKMKADSEDIYIALRDGYRAGIPSCFGAEEIAAAGKTFHILAKTGGEALAGKSVTLHEGTFWPGFHWEPCQS